MNNKSQNDGSLASLTDCFNQDELEKLGILRALQDEHEMRRFLKERYDLMDKIDQIINRTK